MDYDEFRIGDTRRFVANIEDELRYAADDEPIRGLDAIEGSDSSGTVYCVVGLTGALVQVGITDGWWTAVGPHGVGPAVLQSYRYARDKAGIAQLVLARHGRRLPRSPVTRHDPFPEPPADDLAARNDLARRKIEHSAATLAQAERYRKMVADEEPREVTGPRGMFRITMAGVRIVSATVNEHGLHPEDAVALADDARSALLSSSSKEN